MNSSDKPSGNGGPDGIDTSDPNPGQGEIGTASQATGDSKGFLFNKGKLCHRFFTLIFASKGRIIAQKDEKTKLSVIKACPTFLSWNKEQ